MFQVNVDRENAAGNFILGALGNNQGESSTKWNVKAPEFVPNGLPCQTKGYAWEPNMEFL